MSLTVTNLNNNLNKKNITFGLNPYKPVEKANFYDLQSVVNKALKKSNCPEFFPEDPLFKGFVSFVLSIATPISESVERLRMGNQNVKTVGDLYVFLKKEIALEYAKKIGDALHLKMARTDFSKLSD